MKRAKLKSGFVIKIAGVPYELVSDAVIESADGNIDALMQEPPSPARSQTALIMPEPMPQE